ncbi:MAG: hypothetical protein HRT88_13420 [Lentisphaeraceae bacterium]|nr:hypothetical protein [Lentisphaeraceae bacterium]
MKNKQLLYTSRITRSSCHYRHPSLSALAVIVENPPPSIELCMYSRSTALVDLER